MLDGDIEAFLEEVLRRQHPTKLTSLLEGYCLSAQAEGKSPNTVALVAASVRYLQEFLTERGFPTDIRQIGVSELRQFMVDLQTRKRFACHPLTRTQEEPLSGHTINVYLRSLRAFWSWAWAECFVNINPFERIKVPKAPRKVIPTFSEDQIRAMLLVFDLNTPHGFRNYTIILVLLDTGLRVSELTGLRIKDINLENRSITVLGKGNKQRVVPLGARVLKVLWKYLRFFRPEPALPRYDRVFLTWDGRPLTKKRVEAIVERCGEKAGVDGVRVSPHTFRHTFAIMFLRNGGDVFSLQRIMGHSSLDVLRIYVNMAQGDVDAAHRRCSPADNMDLRDIPGGSMRRQRRHLNK